MKTLRVHNMQSAARIFLVLLAFAAGGALLAGDKEGTLPQENLKRWLSLSPKEKSELTSRYRKWQSLPEAQRARIKQNLDSLKKITPYEAALIKENYKKYRRLSPQERLNISERFQKWNGLKERLLSELPQEERKRLVNLPPNARRAKVIELFHHLRRKKYHAFAEWNVPHEERERLRSLPESEFLPAVREIMRAQRKDESQRFLRVLPPEERQNLLNLPEPQREQELRRLIQREFNRRKDQLYEKLAEEEKAKLESLLPGVFHQTVNRLWHERVENEFLKEAVPLRKRLEQILECADPKERERILRTIHQLAWGKKPTPPAPPELQEADITELKKFPPEVVGRIIMELTHKYFPPRQGEPRGPRPPKPTRTE
jgi:hypothetical protein